MTSRTASSTHLWARACLPLLLAACSGKCGGDPNPPYTVQPSAHDAGGDAVAATAPFVLDAGAGTAVAPSGGGKHLEHGTLAADAPDGGQFLAGVFADVDGDGKDDLVAAAARIGAHIPPDVLFFPGAGASLGAPKIIQPAPKFGGGDSCVPGAKISTVLGGVRVEVSAVCDASPGNSSARQTTIFTAKAGDLQARASLTIARNDDRFTVDGRVEGRDNDGSPDVTLTLAVGKTGLPIAYLDRAGGLVVDRAEPSKTFAKEASVVRMVPRDASLTKARELAALHGALCGPKAFVVTYPDARPSCGERAVVDLNLGRALATLPSDPPSAVLLYERAAAEGATAADEKVFLAALTKVAPKKAPLTAKFLTAVPDLTVGDPSFGPLAFGADGALLVREASRTTRVEPATDVEAVLPDAVPWDRSAKTPDGAFSLVEAWDNCDGVTGRATLAPEKGADTKDPLLPIVPRLRPKNCGNHGVILPVLPVRLGDALYAYVDGEPLKFAAPYANAEPSSTRNFLANPGPFGAPLAPKGGAIAVGGRFGVVVAKAKVGSATALTSFLVGLGDPKDGPLSHCTANDDGTFVACVQKGRALVGHL